MANMGKYCKAYLVKRFREFPKWTENTSSLRPLEEDGKEPQPRNSLTDDDYLFLQENFVVTDGIFLDQHVVFDTVTDEWKQFCAEILRFETPDYLRETPAEKTEPQSVTANA